MQYTFSTTKMAARRIEELLSVIEMMDKINECNHHDVIIKVTDNIVAMITREVVARSYLLMYLRQCAPHLVTTTAAHLMLTSNHMTFIKDCLHVVRVLYLTRKKYAHVTLPFSVGSKNDTKLDNETINKVETPRMNSVNDNVNCDFIDDSSKILTGCCRSSDSGIETSFSSQSQIESDKPDCRVQVSQEQTTENSQTTQITSLGGSEIRNEKVESYVKFINDGQLSQSQPVYRLFRLHFIDDSHEDLQIDPDYEEFNDFVTQTWSINAPFYQSMKIYEFSQTDTEQSTMELNIGIKTLDDKFRISSDFHKYIQGKFRYGAFEFVTHDSMNLLQCERLTSTSNF